MKPKHRKLPARPAPAKSRTQFSNSVRSVVLVSIMLAGTFGTPNGAAGQSLQDIQTSKAPLVLNSKGSFFVGGETVQQTFTELGSLGPDDQITINQMYVEYMTPQGGEKVPVVMLHGATLSGKTWDTTPDGRMGWYEYFVRRGHPVYIPDQVGRARSGFNQAVFNDVHAGTTSPTTQPSILRLADKVGVWKNLRFGPTYGVPFPDEKFPVEAVGQLSKQDIPDLNAGVPSPNPTFKALSDLAIQLKGAVLMGHSQSGAFPIQAALVNSTGTKGLILVEPGSCGTTYTDQQIATLAKIPILVVFGDHVDVYTGIPSLPYLWRDSFNGCKALISRINAARGNASLLHPVELGIPGNSHMIMQDKNNLEIADLILKWIHRNVDRKKAASR